VTEDTRSGTQHGEAIITSPPTPTIMAGGGGTEVTTTVEVEEKMGMMGRDVGIARRRDEEGRAAMAETANT